MASPQASTVFCFAFYYAIDKWGLFRVFLGFRLSALPEPVAIAVHLEDVNVVGEPVQ